MLVVAYMAAAEMGCFLELGWNPPEKILDLFVEHRVETNGCYLPMGNGMLGALAMRGRPHIGVDHKEKMRSLILDRTTWNDAERKAILDYCESDVDGLVVLLELMAASIDWSRALFRGRYMSAVARMERSGVPVDRALYRTFVEQWPEIRGRLVEEVDREYGVYDGISFRLNRFEALLKARGMSWPRLPSGTLDLKDDTFKEQCRLFPQLGPLHELRQSLSKLRKSDIQMDLDNRARTSLRPFQSITGRNQPPASEFVFGPSKWLRGIIKPDDGYGIAYIDFVSQEIGIAAGLSGDPRLAEAYAEGDLYMGFAKQSGLAPLDATKATHPVIRERCKTVVLGLNYGMGAEGMAHRAGISIAEAREMIQLHKQLYHQFWEYSSTVVDSAMISNRLSTVFGWQRWVKATDKPTSLMNFPMQANGAEMMRIAAIAATEAGINVCAPIHDAFLIAAPLWRLDDDVRHMCEIMSKAGSYVTGGLPIRTEARIIRYPERYMDERGIAMWNRVVRLVGRPDATYRVNT
ncbi:DNA polymerase [Bradyrhizobium sp. AS23.2]|uniref:DNA polymerase n=1 Tax=Bradyrhizobium sp. AS23.2 TaxID=1680155 RepID=UPI001431FEAB|nr:DNA polymerase [Bradyrhizobium sp. AS23.2]